MKKVKVLKSFIDKYTNEVYSINQILELNDERIKEILSIRGENLIEIIEVKGDK